MVRVSPIHFGVVLGCKGGGGEEKNLLGLVFFQVHALQTQL